MVIWGQNGILINTQLAMKPANCMVPLLSLFPTSLLPWFLDRRPIVIDPFIVLLDRPGPETTTLNIEDNPCDEAKESKKMEPMLNVWGNESFSLPLSAVASNRSHFDPSPLDFLLGQQRYGCPSLGNPRFIS